MVHIDQLFQKHPRSFSNHKMPPFWPVSYSCYSYHVDIGFLIILIMLVNTSLEFDERTVCISSLNHSSWLISKRMAWEELALNQTVAYKYVHGSAPNKLNYRCKNTLKSEMSNLNINCGSEIFIFKSWRRDCPWKLWGGCEFGLYHFDCAFAYWKNFWDFISFQDKI